MREWVLLSPAQVLGAYVALLVLVAAVFGLGYWAGVWQSFGRDEPEPADEGDDLGSVTTVEIAPDGRPRGRVRPPRTGTIHAAHLAPDESPTQVIRRPEVRS